MIGDRLLQVSWSGDEKTVMVTTYRRDGRPVETPMHIAVQGDRAYVRTYAASTQDA